MEFETAVRPRDDPQGGAERQIKRIKLMDVAFANEALTAAGDEVDKAAPKKWRAEAAAEKAERFRKSRL